MARVRFCYMTLTDQDEFMLMVNPKGGNGVTNVEVERWFQATIGEEMNIEVIGFAPWKAGALTR